MTLPASPSVVSIRALAVPLLLAAWAGACVTQSEVGRDQIEVPQSDLALLEVSPDVAEPDAGPAVRDVPEGPLDGEDLPDTSEILPDETVAPPPVLDVVDVLDLPDVPCTRSVCGDVGPCQGFLPEGKCLVDGRCVSEGDSPPGNSCLVCRPSNATARWSAVDGSACDDGDADTIDDACANGVCKGIEASCSDDDPCTEDPRDGHGCVHDPILEGEGCTLEVRLDTPERAEMRAGDPLTQVTGRVAGPRAVSSVSVTLGDANFVVPVSPEDGSFDQDVEAGHGLNVLVVEATDADGRRARTTRSFLWSPEWIPPAGSEGAHAWIADSVAVSIGRDALDDRDSQDADDLATIAGRILPALDLAALAPRPAASAKLDACTYDAFLDSLGMASARVLVTPNAGFLDVRGLMESVFGHGTLETSGEGCTTLTTTMNASSLSAMMALSLGRDSDGRLISSSTKSSVWVSDDLGLSPCEPVCNSLAALRWVLEGTLDDVLATKVTATLNEALGTDHTVQATIPALLSGGTGASLSLWAAVSDAAVLPEGVRLSINATVEDPLPDSTNIGSLGRSRCEAPDVVATLEDYPGIQIAVGDALLNRLAWSLWRAGALRFDVDTAVLGAAGIDPSSYGITDLALKVDARLPPVLAGCGLDPLSMDVQVGELSVRGMLTLVGAPLTVDLALQLLVPVRLEPGSSDLPPTVQLVVQRPRLLEADIISSASDDPTVTPTFTRQLLDSILVAAADRLDGYSTLLTIPSLDLADIVPGLPDGTALSVRPIEFRRALGTTSAACVLVEPTSSSRPSIR